jgi:hypothetical protein
MPELQDRERCDRHEEEIRRLRDWSHKVTDAETTTRAGLAKTEKFGIEIAKLRERSHKLTNDLSILGHQTEQRVDDVQKQISAVSAEFWRVAERIPEDLLSRFVGLEGKIDGLVKTFNGGFTKDWSALKTEHDQMKRLIWWAVVAMLAAVLTALLAHVIQSPK